MSQSYTVDFYYDSYEKEYGDGFYPLVKTNEPVEPTMKETQIQFQLINETWKQMSNESIYGLDGDNDSVACESLPDGK